MAETHPSKPVRPDLLLDALLELLGAAPSELRSTADQQLAVPTWAPGLRVLVAEDNAVNQRVTLSQLTRLGLSADAVADGVEAVEAVAARAYDLVLMDCHMPRMDGYQATEALRAAEAEGTRLPIIAVTANALQGVRERCLAAGMDDCLTKPFTPGRLLQSLMRVLPHKPVPVPGPGKTEQPEVPDASGSEVLDAATLQGLEDLGAAVGEDVLGDAIRAFLDRVAEVRRELADLLATEDLSGLEQTAHRLKGGAAQLGLFEVRDCAQEVESLAADECVAELPGAMAETLVALTRGVAALASRAGD